jgi:hypothetical protein
MRFNSAWRSAASVEVDRSSFIRVSRPNFIVRFCRRRSPKLVALIRSQAVNFLVQSAEEIGIPAISAAAGGEER